jgi:hypothetical protein
MFAGFLHFKLRRASQPLHRHHQPPALPDGLALSSIHAAQRGSVGRCCIKRARSRMARGQADTPRLARPLFGPVRRFTLNSRNPKGKAMARPTKYKAEYAKQAAKLCRLGATDAQLAEFFEVAVSTVALWKVQYKGFSDALKLAKKEADSRVEQSLYQRACGYEHDEVDIRVVDHAIVQTEIRKFYPPDTTACIFWLKNRKPAEWRDKVETELSGTVRFGKIERTLVDPAQ